MKRGLLFKLSPPCFYTGCVSGDGGHTYSRILQGISHAKLIDDSGEREDKTVITGLLVIVAGAIISNTLFAVPRYSASVPQVGDSSNAITAQQVDSKMNNERGGVEKEIMVDAVKGCRDRATIGIVSGSLREDIASEAAGGLPGVASESGDRQSWVQSSGAQAIQNAGSDHDPLISPKYGLIPAANIREYPHTDTYLDLSDADVSHYFILKEDYVFQNLDGRSYSIPAGFIWDGASIAKWLGAVPGLLEVGNTRYNSALAEGLIHDYMYRNPQQFTKKESDDLFYENLKRNNNLNPKVMSAGVKVFGGRAYLGHAFNRISHEYWFDKLPDFYANNLKLYHRSQEKLSPSAKQKAKDMLLGVKKNPLEEKVCHADSVSGNELKATDVVSVNSGNLAGEVGVRGWCKCPNRSANIVTGPLFRMGEDFNVADYSYFFCGDCYKCRKDFNAVADIIKDGTICIWDVKVARANGLDGKTIPDVKAQQQLSEAQDRIMQIPDGKVVIPGLCRCESPRIWLFGELPKRIEMCKDCGRPRSPIPLSAKNPRQPRKLRRCRKTSTSIFVCTCAGDTDVKPNIHACPYDDGDVELSLVCTKCSQVKYSAFVPVREFKKKFANGKPDPQAMLVYMIGTVDIKAAMLAADKEASSQN